MKRLVLVGGGHAHVQVIKSLNIGDRPKNLDVTLIDTQSSASYSGMVPGCVSGLYAPRETLIDLRTLAKWAGIVFVEDTVVDVDPGPGEDGSGRLILADGGVVEYDAVSLDVGSAARGSINTPGVLEYAIPTRPINELISRIEGAEESLSNSSSADIVVVGGGAAGIELAFAMRARWGPICSLKGLDCRVTLLDSGSVLLPHEAKACRSVVVSNLEKREICVRHCSSVERIEADSIILTDGTTLPFTHCIWACGAAPHPHLTANLRSRGVSLDERGWIRVSPTLQSLSHPNIFAAGDCASIILGNDRPSPPKAGVYAVRAGPILISNLTRFLHPSPPPLLQYEPQSDFLKLIMCGDGTAIGFRFGIPLYGKWVWELKDKIDTMFMDLFREENLPVLGEGGELDTRQYDLVEEKPERLHARDASVLLARTDDGVEYQKAWHVLRDMMADEGYKEQVLEFLQAGDEVVFT